MEKQVEDLLSDADRHIVKLVVKVLGAAPFADVIATIVGATHNYATDNKDDKVKLYSNVAFEAYLYKVLSKNIDAVNVILDRVILSTSTHPNTLRDQLEAIILNFAADMKDDSSAKSN